MAANTLPNTIEATTRPDDHTMNAGSSSASHAGIVHRGDTDADDRAAEGNHPLPRVCQRDAKADGAMPIANTSDSSVTGML